MKINYINVLLLLLGLNISISYGQEQNKSFISGNLILDDSWDSEIFLSYIPTYDNMYLMSNDMIVAKTRLDNNGNFEFDTDFLLPKKNLYRLHIIKKGDSPASLIIGGKNENHLFLIANQLSQIKISSNFSFPPFKNVSFKNSPESTSIQHIRNIIFKADSSFSESGMAKRMMIEKKIEKDLFKIAESSDYFLVSLYAIYEGKFESNNASNAFFYKSFIAKWKNEENDYFKSLRRQMPQKTHGNLNLLMIIIGVIGLSGTLYLFRKKIFNQKRTLNELSFQERKIFELLRQGLTNQEISSQCSISINTVKSHVSSVYSKLDIKSRKEILNLEL
ncbi:MAG: hypothetical protein COB98_04240 [Flavobacteriaceae bacterium]|nr:MAG: hypothetical protein COB98_04240 [Flavobacteriaceae bacterium]